VNWVWEEAESQRDIAEHQDVRDDYDVGVLRRFKLYVVFHRALSEVISLKWNYLAGELDIHNVLEGVNQVLVVTDSFHWSVHSVVVVVVHSLVEGLEVADKNLALPFLSSLN
jgi:hypothetical protein